MNNQCKHLTLPSFSGLGITKESEGEIVVTRIGVTPNQYVKLSNEIKDVLWISEKERQEVKNFLALPVRIQSFYRSFALLKHLEQFVSNGLNQKALSQALNHLEDALS